MGPTLSGIEHFSASVGVFCRANPPLQRLWAAIFLLTRTLADLHQQQKQNLAVLGALVAVQRSMPRFSACVLLYPDGGERLESAVAETYLLLVEFCIRVKRVLTGRDLCSVGEPRRKVWAWGRARPRASTVGVSRHIEVIRDRIILKMGALQDRAERESKAAVASAQEGPGRLG